MINFGEAGMSETGRLAMPSHNARSLGIMQMN